MNATEFCYWLQGALEIMNPIALDSNELEVIKEHLALVLKKVTPIVHTSPVPIPDPFADMKKSMGKGAITAPQKYPGEGEKYC